MEVACAIITHIYINIFSKMISFLSFQRQTPFIKVTIQNI